MRTLRHGVMLFIAFLYVTSSSPASGQSCIGDCDGNGAVAVNELIRCVTIVLGSAELEESKDLHTRCDPAKVGEEQSSCVWYRFTAPDTGTVALHTILSSYNTVLAVHVGACGALSELACNDNALGPLRVASSALVVAVTGGVEYFVEVTNFGIRPGGLLDIRAEFARGPFCRECEGQQDCGEELSCFNCFNFCTGAARRCASPAAFAVCADGIYFGQQPPLVYTPSPA